MKKWILPFVVAAGLSWLALQRTDFSLDKISAPLVLETDEIDGMSALQQSYHFLGKGKQSFAFESADGETVLKFFNRSYFQMPWYSFLFSKEVEKRRRREFFYLHSYPLAEKFFRSQTGILYLHLGKTRGLPTVTLRDKASRVFSVDLNEVPFVLQRKGEPFYSVLQAIYEQRGNKGLMFALDVFLEMIATRIARGVADADHDVEHNFGFLDGRPFHLDPGRLYLRDFSEKESFDHEWWSSTHSLRKWLRKKYPETVALFDERVQLQKNGPK